MHEMRAHGNPWRLRGRLAARCTQTLYQERTIHMESVYDLTAFAVGPKNLRYRTLRKEAEAVGGVEDLLGEEKLICCRRQSPEQGRVSFDEQSRLQRERLICFFDALRGPAGVSHDSAQHVDRCAFLLLNWLVNK